VPAGFSRMAAAKTGGDKWGVSGDNRG
jgi:hypothetical protein